jgi:putative ABC transport system permease protein
MVENIRFAFRGIKTHKMRSFLTMLGVIIGIASIIAIVSIVEGTSQQLQSSLVGAGNNVLSVDLSQNGYQYDLSYNALPSGVPMVSEDVLASIRSLEHVQGASAYCTRQDYNMVYYQNQGMGYGNVYGVGKGYFDTLQYQVLDGRGFSEEEYDSFDKVAVVDKTAAENLFGNAEPVGQIIEIKGEPYVVIGVVGETDAEDKEYESITEYYMYGWGNYGTVYISKSTWPIVFQFDEPENVAIRTDTADAMAEVGNAAAEILNQQVSSMDVQYAYLNAASDAEELGMLTTAIQLMLVGIASLSLLVGGIGVMNIMLVSVTERTAEIGLKKALGAKRRNIMAQFLTESAVLTGVGGVIGILVGILLAKIISVVTGLSFIISVPWVLIALGFSLLIGIVFGAMPASTAAKLSPIDALRRE